MPRILLILFTCFLTSCLTEKKVNRWNNEHETEAAKYCADKFPPDTITRTLTQNIDSAGYYDAYLNMAGLADSLFWKLDSLQYLPPEMRGKINIDSIRKVVDKEIRKRLIPCIDTVKVVTNTIVDRARERYLQGMVDKKDFVIAEMQVKANEREDKIRSQRKWFWLFWGLVALIGLYTFAKIRFKLPI